MKRRISKTAIYGSRNKLVAAGIRESLPGGSGDPFALSIRMFPQFQGRLAIREGGGTIVIQCKDNASKDALLSALQEALTQRDLDERRWIDRDELDEHERKEPS